MINWAPVHVESGRKGGKTLVKVALSITANQSFLLGSAQLDTGGKLFNVHTGMYSYFDSVSQSLSSLFAVTQVNTSPSTLI